MLLRTPHDFCEIACNSCFGNLPAPAISYRHSIFLIS